MFPKVMHNRIFLTAAAMGLIIALNTCLVAKMLNRPGDIFNDQPVTTADFTFHHHYSVLGSASLRESGATWGYDPTFMAGALYTPIFDPSNYLIELVAAVLPFLSVSIVIKLLFTIGTGFIPLLLFQSARNLRFNRPVSITAGVLAALYLWFGLPLEVTRYGMFLYVLGAAWGVYVLGWWLGFVEGGERRKGIGLVISGALGVPIHLASFMGVAVPGVLSFVIYARRLDRRRWAWTAATIIVILICSLPWIGPYIKFQAIKTTAALDLQSIPFAGFLFLITRGHASIEVFLWLFSIAGFLAMSRESPVRLYAPILAGAITLAILYFTGHISGPMADLEPRRFAIPLYFLLALPAARGVGLLVGWFTSLGNRGKIISALILLLLIPAFKKSVGNAAGIMGSILTGAPPGAAPLFEWLNKSTDRSARILIEDSIHAPLPGVPEGMSLLGIMPLYVDREFIGGPYPWTFIKPHIVDFQDGVLIGKRIEEYDTEALSSVFILYNIRWIVCFSRPAIERFLSMPQIVHPVGMLGTFALLEVKISTGGFFMKGSGRLSAKPQEIRVNGASSQNGEVILKYHWMPCMKVEPGGVLRSVAIPGDPMGFMGISGAPPDFRIVPDYKRRWLPNCDGK